MQAIPLILKLGMHTARNTVIRMITENKTALHKLIAGTVAAVIKF